MNQCTSQKRPWKGHELSITENHWTRVVAPEHTGTSLQLPCRVQVWEAVDPAVIAWHPWWACTLQARAVDSHDVAGEGKRICEVWHNQATSCSSVRFHVFLLHQVPVQQSGEKVGDPHSQNFANQAWNKSSKESQDSIIVVDLSERAEDGVVSWLAPHKLDHAAHSYHMQWVTDDDTAAARYRFLGGIKAEIFQPGDNFILFLALTFLCFFVSGCSLELLSHVMLDDVSKGTGQHARKHSTIHSPETVHLLDVWNVLQYVRVDQGFLSK